MSTFARSASGPGLSINTGAANLFGSSTANQQQQPQAAGVLFGSTAQTSQPAQSGGLFGTATQQPQTSTSLFGQPQQQQKPGGLFGSTTATAAQPQQQTGGLFGQPQQAQTGGLFGASTAQPQQQQQTGGLFGATAQQPQQTTGGLFGQPQQQQQQPQQTGGLFGATQQQPAQTGGLFGASTNIQQPQTGGLFGSSTMAAKPSVDTVLGRAPGPGGTTFSTNLMEKSGFGLTLGQSFQQQPSQTIPGVRIDLTNIKGTTRFNDLQEDLQKSISQIDELIQKCIRDKEAVDAFIPPHGEQLAQVPNDVSFVGRKSEGVANALASDVTAVKELRELVKIDAEAARMSFRAIDNLKLPAQYQTPGLWSSRSSHTVGAVANAAAVADAEAQSNADLISFFSREADEMDRKLKTFESHLGEMEVHLHGVQGNITEQMQRLAVHSKNGSDEKLVELAAVLREFEEGIFQVAAQVGNAREGMTELQLKEFMSSGANGLH